MLMNDEEQAKQSSEKDNAQPKDTINVRFANYVAKVFDFCKALFTEKRKQYSTSDPLDNFRRGAALRLGHEPTYNDMKDEAMGYMRKHLAFVQAHDVAAEKLQESLMDIAVYSVIIMFMAEEARKQQ